MQELQLKLKEARVDELEIVTQLAKQIWNKHYVPIIGQQQVDYMVSRMYSPESLRKQLVEKHHRFFLITFNGKDILGFISTHEEKGDEWFLNKFYILQERAAKGLGTQAFKKLIELIQPRKLTLTVNRQNYKSINFYFKNNFKIDCVADFDIGDGYVMNDFVMTWVRSDLS